MQKERDIIYRSNYINIYILIYINISELHLTTLRWLCSLKLPCVYRGGGTVCGCSGFPGVHTFTAEAEGNGDSYTGAVIYLTGKPYTQVSSY